ncbi:MAG: hypothetical protein N2422_05355 [Rhodobacteraceae bacterium]|nr:hypothetical protein [Paracoccaceae bacterium]
MDMRKALRGLAALAVLATGGAAVPAAAATLAPEVLDFAATANHVVPPVVDLDFAPFSGPGTLTGAKVEIVADLVVGQFGYIELPLSFKGLTFISFFLSASEENVFGLGKASYDLLTPGNAFSAADFMNGPVRLELVFTGLSEQGEATRASGKVSLQYSYDAGIAPVPLPASGLLLLAALGGALALRRRGTA